MGSHPLNLGLRFILEIVVLIAFGMWGSRLATGILGFVLAILFPLIAATLWGTFAVIDDPSRSGKAPVPVAGWVRLMLEGALFVGATLAFIAIGRQSYAFLFAVVSAVHYALSYDRIAWLLKQRI